VKDEGKRSELVEGLRALISSPVTTALDLPGHVQRIEDRTKQIDGRLTLWAGITSVMLNLGAAFGIWGFTRGTSRFGRRPAFAIAYLLALVSTAWVFLTLDKLTDVFWMVPIMGFCQLALFGGYAIYFPELFPTRLRSTGISFCYNVARYVAAAGPLLLGFLYSRVFSEELGAGWFGGGFEEPMRYAGVTMCSVFLIGLCALPFAPETKGKPLPE
jgi:MFS family permease